MASLMLVRILGNEKRLVNWSNWITTRTPLIHHEKNMAYHSQSKKKDNSLSCPASARHLELELACVSQYWSNVSSAANIRVQLVLQVITLSELAMKHLSGKEQDKNRSPKGHEVTADETKQG